MKLISVRNMTYLVVAAGIVMFIAALAERVDRLSFYLVCTVAFNIVPYIICLILVKTTNRPVMALCASMLLLIVDVWLYKDIIDYEGLTIHEFVYATIVTRYSPLLKIVFVVPVGCLIGFVIDNRLH